jgi:hypothetical protein
VGDDGGECGVAGWNTRVWCCPVAQGIVNLLVCLVLAGACPVSTASDLWVRGVEKRDGCGGGGWFASVLLGPETTRGVVSGCGV